MTRRSKCNIKVPLKLIDTVYSITSKKNKNKNDVIEIDKEEISDNKGDVYNGCDDDIVASGEIMNEGNEKENNQMRNDVNGELGNKIGTNTNQQSNDDDVGKLNNSPGQHYVTNELAKDDSVENRDESSFGPIAKDNVEFVSSYVNLAIHDNIRVNTGSIDIYAKVVGNNDNELDKNLFFCTN
ncbi:hypothetical protein Tco_0814149 [Tanacetum coccineum]